MRENKGIAEWLNRQMHHRSVMTCRLPSPSFPINGREQLSFSTNSDLAVASDQRVIAAATKGLYKYGVGNCESGLLSGYLSVYDELLDKLVDAKSKLAAMLFATGYLTDLGYACVYHCASEVNDSYAYFGDEFYYISIRRGIRLSSSPRYTYRHRDCIPLERLLTESDAGCRIIVSDGVFSQHGHRADAGSVDARRETRSESRP